MKISAKLQEIMKEIVIPGADAIRGNITLPLTIEDATVSWKSSAPDVITDRAVGRIAAGVVTRGSCDRDVLLTATVTRDGETAVKDIIVHVLKAPTKIKDEDYTSYLFGHFIGEEGPDGEQIYFAVSEEGLNFKDMNGGKPVLTSNVGEKGMRDPFIYRSHEGDRFFMVATDLSIYNRGGWKKNEQGYYDASTTGSSYLVLWESDDLVNWRGPELIKAAPENAGMAWAPEIIYCDETGEYIIFFASSIMDPATRMKAKPNAIYYVATRDFVNFSETKLFIDCQYDGEKNGKEREIIDTTVIKIGDTYYSASKDGDNDEKNGGIRIMKTKDLLDPYSWEKVLDLDELHLDLSEAGVDVLDNSQLEGPEFFRYNKADRKDPSAQEIGIIADRYATGQGYLPISTADIEDRDNAKGSWKVLSGSEYSFDKLKKRHGTILRITEKEKARLKKAFLK